MVLGSKFRYKRSIFNWHATLTPTFKVRQDTISLSLKPVLKTAKKVKASLKAKIQKKKMKILLAKLKQSKNKTIKWVPPKKKKHKLPLKKMVYGASGLLDRLSTRLFKEHLHNRLYPQRGTHKRKMKH